MAFRHSKYAREICGLLEKDFEARASAALACGCDSIEITETERLLLYLWNEWDFGLRGKDIWVGDLGSVTLKTAEHVTDDDRDFVGDVSDALPVTHSVGAPQ